MKLRRFREVREPKPEEFTINYTAEDMRAFIERSMYNEVAQWVKDNHPNVYASIKKKVLEDI